VQEQDYPLLTTGTNKDKHQYGLWTFFPHMAGEPWILLGELDKFVAASPQRFKSVTVSRDRIAMELTGAPKETVRLWAINPKETVSYLEVTLSSSGTASAVFA